MAFVRYYSRPDSLYRPRYPAHVQHGKEPAFVAAVYSVRPRVGTRCLGMPLQVEDGDCAIPSWFAFEGLAHRHRLDKRSYAAVLGFDGAFEFFWADFAHALPV